ncbi:MAG: hypothetical protein WDO12_10850 [Pseudomonadota bacterium]
MGAREIPVLSVEMILGSLQGWRSFLAMLVLLAMLFATGAAAFWVGPVAALGAGAMVALVLPLALLILGWTNDFTQAIHPPTWLRVARVLGRDFVQLEGAGVVLAAVVALLFGAMHGQLIAKLAVSMLGWLLLVALAGLVIHRRREYLATAMPFYAGIELAPSPAELARRRQRAIDAIYALWRNGARADAWRALERQAAATPSPDEELRWAYGISRGWDAPALSARMAQELIPLDLRAGRIGSVLNLVREQWARDAQFRPRTARETLDLSRLAGRYADAPLALALLVGFERLTQDEALRAAANQLRDELSSRNAG